MQRSGLANVNVSTPVRGGTVRYCSRRADRRLRPSPRKKKHARCPNLCIYICWVKIPLRERSTPGVLIYAYLLRFFKTIYSASLARFLESKMKILAKRRGLQIDDVPKAARRMNFLANCRGLQVDDVPKRSRRMESLRIAEGCRCSCRAEKRRGGLSLSGQQQDERVGVDDDVVVGLAHARGLCGHSPASLARPAWVRWWSQQRCGSVRYRDRLRE